MLISNLFSGYPKWKQVRYTYEDEDEMDGDEMVMEEDGDGGRWR